jgi:hypothetical protein
MKMRSSARVLRFFVVALAAASMLAACTPSAPSRTSGSPSSPRQTLPSSGPATAPGTLPQSTPPPASTAEARRCPVTIPRGVAPAAGTYGNGKLRVGGLWPRGVIAVGPHSDYLDSQGRIRMKFPWWTMVRGLLRITGRRLDGPAPPLSAQVPYGYGLTGFQASGVTFPTPGCWQMNGIVGQTSLSVVTLVTERHSSGP